MKQINSILNARKQKLLYLKEQLEKSLQNAPEGFLRIGRRGTRTQYYHRTNPKDSTGKYIRTTDTPLAHALAQKDYDTKVLRATEQELTAISKYFDFYPKNIAEDIYETLNLSRQQLITPIQESDDQYIKNWLAEEYPKKGFDEHLPELYTSKGERVRSKSEIIIADSLARESVPYRYESPIQLAGYGRIYPDFTILNVRLRKTLYWEHLGMMDDPAYAEKAIQKLATYEQNGIFPGENLILTFETKQNPINQKLVALMIQRYLK